MCEVMALGLSNHLLTSTDTLPLAGDAARHRRAVSAQQSAARSVRLCALHLCISDMGTMGVMGGMP